MFTGLVATLGTIASLTRKGPSARLAVKNDLPDVMTGDSIAINGVCLTVIDEKTAGGQTFDVSVETLESTNLGELSPGDRVNIEPALRADARLGGHFVTGHVDGAGKIVSRRKVGNAERIEIECPPHLSAQLVEKGSVAVDGISLTVVDVMERGFTLFIIPHTGAVTTIGFKKPGETVNIETDIIGKYIEKYLRRMQAPGGGAGTAEERDLDLLAKLRAEGYTERPL